MRNGVNFQCNCCQGNNNSSLLMGRNNFNNLGYCQGQQQQGYYQQDQQIKQSYDRQRDCQTMIFQLRKRVHQTVAQNLLLKEQLSKLNKYVIQMQSSNQSLRGQLQNSLQELKNYDNQIQQYRKQIQTYSQQIQQYQKQIQQLQNSLIDSKQFSQFLQQRITSYQNNMKQSQLVIENNSRFMYNLNQQNQLLIKIKTTLTKDNLRLKNSYQQIIENYQFKQSQMNKLTYQIDYLLKQITQLQEIINNKRICGISSENLLSPNNIRNLQMMTKDRSLLLTNIDRNILPNMDRKQSDIRNKDIIDMRNHQVEIERFLINEQVNRKLLKYKKKALKYKQQRDQLLLQIEEAKQEIGNITLTREFNID